MDREHQALFPHPRGWKVEVAHGVEDRLLDFVEHRGELQKEIDRPAGLAPRAVAGAPSSDPPHPNALSFESCKETLCVESNPGRRLIPEGGIEGDRRRWGGIRMSVHCRRRDAEPTRPFAAVGQCTADSCRLEG